LAIGNQQCTDKLKHIGHQIISRSNPIDGVTKRTLSHSLFTCNSTGCGVRRFLQMMADVSAGPLPIYVMTICSPIKASPPVEICLASKATAHCFHNVTRICKEIDLARFAQRFQSDCSGRNFGLLVGRGAKILADSAPYSFVTQQSNSSGTAANLSITQTGSVTVNLNLFERGYIFDNF
jgi:hypothetical protein